MTKAMIAQSLQEETGLDLKAVRQSVEVFISSIKEALKNGEKASLVGFGTFSTKVRPARTGLNPRTGKSVEISEKRVVVFKPGKEFRDRVEALDIEPD